MKRSILAGLAALVLASGCGPDNTSSGDRPDLTGNNIDMKTSDSKVDGGLDGYVSNDLGDGYVSTDALDGNTGNDAMPDLYNGDMVPQIHPIARLDNCTETDPMDGLCIYRMNINQVFWWYATSSTAPAGRTLTDYFVFYDTKNNPLAGSGSPNPKIGVQYNATGKFSARLRVTDDTNDTGTQDFYNIVN